MLKRVVLNEHQLMQKHNRKQVVTTLTNVLINHLLGMLIFTEG